MQKKLRILFQTLLFMRGFSSLQVKFSHPFRPLTRLSNSFCFFKRVLTITSRKIEHAFFSGRGRHDARERNKSRSKNIFFSLVG